MGGSFIDVVYPARTLEELHREAHGKVIRGLAFRTTTVGVSPVLGAFPTKVSMLISHRGSLFDQFRPLQTLGHRGQGVSDSLPSR